MKHIFCVAIVLLLSIDYAQAAEVPFVELKGHTKTIWSIVFTPDGKKVATAGHDGTVRIWDVDTGKELQKLVQGGNYGSTRVAFSPDG
ncbi:MAG: hypothetical protein FWE95_11650, partial [Planctomycetaceae bacterium]|nr:hypothetical protein [Planctomycetaceae bacterium]